MAKLNVDAFSDEYREVAPKEWAFQSLDEAKEIIKMMMGNTYLNGEVYNLDKCFTQEIKSGSKIFCEGQSSCLKLEENLNNKGMRRELDVMKQECGVFISFLYLKINKSHH